MNCRPGPRLSEQGNLQALISDFLVKRTETPRDDVRCYREATDLKSAISAAAHAKRNDGSRHSHQWRIKPETIAQTEPAFLAAEPRIAAARSFNELHEIIASVCRKVNGAGVLYIYDTALRIGHFQRLAPDKVFLHAGTREGAEQLGLGKNKAVLRMAELPAPLRRLSATEVEDFLCLYKEELRRLRKGESVDLTSKRLAC